MTTDKKVEKVIILQCIDAIYLTMVARLIYYKHCLKTLKRTRLQINTYDPCVANLLVNYKQKTICFHVDYCKLIHKDSKVNDKFINTLRDEYDSVFEDGSGKVKVIQ